MQEDVMQSVNFNLSSLLGGEIQIVSKDEGYVRRALGKKISFPRKLFDISVSVTDSGR